MKETTKIPLPTLTPWYDFEPKERDFLAKVVTRGGKTVKTYFCKNWISLDTETAHNHDEENPLGWIYQWAFKFGDEIVIGRRPSELVEALRRIHRALDLSSERQLVVYVHNLSYDIQYLKDFLTAEFGKPRVLAVKPHKFITFEVDGLVFRCSYKLSNKSLARWSSDLGTTHRKLKEEKAYYDEIHYQDDELTDENWLYQVQDVIVLDEAVEAQMKAYNDNILTIPLTSTGYVRRDERRNYKTDRRNRKRFLQTRLYEDNYEACRGEFAGGLTHGARWFAGKTIRPEKDKGEFIRHRDFRSHYPSQQRTRKFPVGNFMLYGTHLDFQKVNELSKKYCVLMKITFENAHIRKGVPLPIISASKAYLNRKGDIDIVEDNGRALDIEGIFTVYATELDLYWLLKQYKFDGYDVDEAYISAKGYLPDYMKKTVDAYFLGKTKWKKELAEAKEAKADLETIVYLSLELMKSKNGLNGIYGCTATDPVRIAYLLEDNGEWKTEAPDVKAALNKYYASEKSFNRYQFGIYTTSHARYELLEFAELIQDNGGTVLYVDTDSIFYVSNEACENAIEGENERRRKRAIDLGAFVEYDGQKVTYDAFDDEGEDITAFRFLHSKCYAYECDGKLHCTIAGVSEFEDATLQYSRVDELGTIEELAAGKVFTRCGGTKAHYVEMKPATVDINGHMTELGSACIITPTTKTLKHENEVYDDLIEWEVVS